MDRVYCPDCGEEYNRLAGHQHDPRLLKSIELATQADAEVRWGGAREGAGRPANQYPTKFLKIQASDSEMSRILEKISSTRTRTEILLKYISESKTSLD